MATELRVSNPFDNLCRKALQPRISAVAGSKEAGDHAIEGAAFDTIAPWALEFKVLGILLRSAGESSVALVVAIETAQAHVCFNQAAAAATYHLTNQNKTQSPSSETD